MSGPWYEESGPTSLEIRNKMLQTFLAPQIPTKLVKIREVIAIIEEVIEENLKEHGGWGSYRGYYTFTHSNLVKSISKKINEKKEEKALEKIKDFIRPWAEHILYRPPSDNKPTGRMYLLAKESFTSHNENKPKQSALEF